MRTLQISRSSAGFIERGHPWVRPDRFTVGLAELSRGEQITLVDERGHRLASALADPDGDICARVFSSKPDQPLDVAQRFESAWKRRDSLHADASTNAYRIVHGEADGLPAMRVERYSDIFVVVVFAGCATPLIEPLCAALAAKVPNARIVIREHTDDLQRRAVRTRLWAGTEPDANESIEVMELAVRYSVRPFAGLATGLYVDQRPTRAWLKPHAAGKRVLNLFAYTGAFSISALTAGAAQALDVDLSAPALQTASENARLNGVTERHRTARADCSEYLSGGSDPFDLIIIDPPTAAQGARGWVARRDYPPLLASALARLAPGGLMIACVNTLGGKPFDLARIAKHSAQSAHIEVNDVPPPRLECDLPQMSGFPEGRPYRLVALRRP
jgi:23S rRNA (cytosine1962-C5)-methyltransferase